MINEVEKIEVRKPKVEKVTKELKTVSLATTLVKMEVGEICDAPDDYSLKTIKVVCYNMKKQGYLFTLRTLPELGRIIIIRLK